MDGSDNLDIVLFALTGFGNTVLKALLKETRVNVGAVFTVKYNHPFPYYEEQQLMELCSERGVICYHGVKVGSDVGMELLREHSPDLIIVATFKQILAQNVLCLPQLGVVNLHPSLLPRYRGPCPTCAALYNDEKVTGVTAHYVTEKLDEGDILFQRSIPIGEVDNDGQLRQKLARLAGEMVPELVGMFTGIAKPAGIPQDHRLASLAPRPTVEDGYLELATDVHTIRRKVRACNPLPGTSVLIGDRRVAVDQFELSQDVRADGFYENDNSIDLIIDAQAIRLYKKTFDDALDENVILHRGDHQ
jgi:methionyl-tRNA formyltransferase